MRRVGWLNDNIASLLAILWTLFAFKVISLVLLKEVKAPENITFLIINSVSNICMLILGYYYVSSAVRKSQQDALDKIGENTSSTSTSTTTTNSKTNENINDSTDQ